MEDKHYLALGKFVSEYSGVELVMFFLLRHTAGLSYEVAAALFSGTRVKGAMDLIGRLHEPNGTVLPPRLKEAFGQLSAINTARDWILHWGVSEDFNTGALSVSNFKAHAARAEREMPFSAARLDTMTADLKTISAIIANNFIPAGIPERAEHEQAALAPLLYKPTQSAAPQRKSRQ